jgi:hypothetical protein
LTDLKTPATRRGFFIWRKPGSVAELKDKLHCDQQPGKLSYLLNCGIVAAWTNMGALCQNQSSQSHQMQLIICIF